MSKSAAWLVASFQSLTTLTLLIKSENVAVDCWRLLIAWQNCLKWGLLVEFNCIHINKCHSKIQEQTGQGIQVNQFAWADAKSEMKSEWQKKGHLCWELQCHSWAPSQNLKLTFSFLHHKVLDCWLSVTSCVSWHVLAQLLTHWNLVLKPGMLTASAVNFHCCFSEMFTSLRPCQLKWEDL